LLAVAPPVAAAEAPRALLATAAFQTSEKPRALALVGQAIAATDRALASRPADREATLQRAIAIGYRARLTRSRSDARACLKSLESLAARDPRDAEAQLALAGWHLDAIDQLGGFMARTALGAKAAVGQAALGRAVALDDDGAFIPGLAAMMLIRHDADAVAQARAWAETAASSSAPSPLDAYAKRAAIAILPALRAKDGEAAAVIARKLLPFGKLAD
jgi:hypothetical protein